MFLRTVLHSFGSIKKLVVKTPSHVAVTGMVAGAILGLGLILSPITRADNVVFNSARDCDSNAVINCGAMTINELTTKYNSNAGTRHIFDYFGITSKDISNLRQFAHAGTVQKNGNVLVDGKIVATNARTAGRMYIPGSTKVTYQGTTFYTRTPSVSFLNNSLDAFVIMQNGSFSYAILASCGNPVIAHPNIVEKPAYQIEKTVRIDSGNWKKNVDINYGETAEFKVVVNSTGNAPVTDLYVRDALPDFLSYIPGTLTQDGATANATVFFGDKGIRVARLATGDSVVFRFKATTKSKTQPADCSDRTVTNIARMDANNLPSKKDDATVDVTCKQVHKPNYRIVKQVQLIGAHSWSESVTVPNGTNVRYRVVVTSTGDTAVQNLVIGDALPSNITYVKNSLEHDGKTVTNDTKFFSGGINFGSLAPGKSTSFTFIAKVGSTNANDPCTEQSLKNVASANGDILPPIYDDAIVVKQCPQVQRYSCDLLTATSLGDRDFRFAVTYTATGGAVLNTATYNFGDNTDELVTNLLTTTHQYAQDGTYTVNVRLTFMVNGVAQTVTSDGCSLTISSSTPPNMCVIPGKENLPADSPECTTEVVPGEMPNTGPSGLLGLFVGSSVLGTFGYRFWMIRRQGR